MSNKGFALDERNRSVIGKIATILYFFTIYFLVGDMLYRQFVLHQSPQQFEDIAVLVTINVLSFIALVFFFGGVSVGKVSFSKLIVGYILFVIVGLGFTVFKYRRQPFDFLVDKAVIVVTISAALFALVTLVAYIGKQKIERSIE